MYSTIRELGRRLRLGVIGGGAKSFIGPVHRAAARMDDNYEVVASVLSSDPERAKKEGVAIGIAPDRAYGSAEEMFAAEKARADGIDVVAIMSPNDSHYRYAVAAIEAGYDIICDKPLATNLDDALDLVKRVKAAGIVFCQTFNYTGYPLVRQAMAMIRDGDIGAVRMVEAEYIQGYNYALTEGEKSGDRNWHFVPEKAGQSLVLGDIGSHAHHLVRYVTGQNLAKLVADVTTTVPGRAPLVARPCRRPLSPREQRAGRDVGDAGRRRRGPRPLLSASSARRAGSNGCRRRRTSSSSRGRMPRR